MTEEPLRITPSVSIPLRELRFRFSRSGGPGGQNVNRRETQVELIFDLETSPSLGPRQRVRAIQRLRNRLDASGKLHIVVSEERTQGRNREIAIERFSKLLANALKPVPKRRKTKPSARARERRLQEKGRRSRLKRDRAAGWHAEE